MACLEESAYGTKDVCDVWEPVKGHTQRKTTSWREGWSLGRCRCEIKEEMAHSRSESFLLNLKSKSNKDLFNVELNLTTDGF